MNGIVSSTSDSKVVTVSKLAQWRIESFRPKSSRCSDAFKIGIWNWYLRIENYHGLDIQLFLKSCDASKDLLPWIKFVIRVSSPDPERRTYVSPVHQRTLQTIEDFSWCINYPIEGRFTVEVEFLDLKTFPLAGGKPISIWPSPEMQALLSQSNLRYLSCMLKEDTYTYVTIETSSGDLKVPKAILASSSPMFKSMFLHDLKKKKSSMIEMDMSLKSCSALLSCIYGAIEQEDFLTHRPSLLSAAIKYNMFDVKNLCEQSLLEDINSGNVLERLHEAWLYQLHKLKKDCLTYLFDFGKVHDLTKEMHNFFQQADRGLLWEVFQNFGSLNDVSCQYHALRM